MKSQLPECLGKLADRTEDRIQPGVRRGGAAALPTAIDPECQN